MTAEHVGEGLLAVLRREINATPGFVRDLGQASGVHVTEINVRRIDRDRTRLELVVKEAKR